MKCKNGSTVEPTQQPECCLHGYNAEEQTVTYLLFMCGQITVDFLRLEERGAAVYSKANIQQSLFHVH